MVFESLVTELVNKYLGDFIENLDSSQLKIGIWGGELGLLKSSLFNMLDHCLVHFNMNSVSRTIWMCSLLILYDK